MHNSSKHVCTKGVSDASRKEHTFSIGFKIRSVNPSEQAIEQHSSADVSDGELSVYTQNSTSKHRGNPFTLPQLLYRSNAMNVISFMSSVALSRIL